MTKNTYFTIMYKNIIHIILQYLQCSYLNTYMQICIFYIILTLLLNLAKKLLCYYWKIRHAMYLFYLDKKINMYYHFIPPPVFPYITIFFCSSLYTWTIFHQTSDVLKAKRERLLACIINCWNGLLFILCSLSDWLCVCVCIGMFVCLCTWGCKDIIHVSSSLTVSVPFIHGLFSGPLGFECGRCALTDLLLYNQEQWPSKRPNTVRTFKLRLLVHLECKHCLNSCVKMYLKALQILSPF